VDVRPEAQLHLPHLWQQNPDRSTGKGASLAEGETSYDTWGTAESRDASRELALGLRLAATRGLLPYVSALAFSDGGRAAGASRAKAARQEALQGIDAIWGKETSRETTESGEMGTSSS